MKIKTLIAALICALMCITPVSASETEAVETETATSEVSDEEGGLSKSQTLGGLLMVGAIVTASWISMLIFKGRDKTKYL